MGECNTILYKYERAIFGENDRKNKKITEKTNSCAKRLLKHHYSYKSNLKICKNNSAFKGIFAQDIVFSVFSVFSAQKPQGR